MSSARLSPALRCHDDHLSPVFCCLDTHDFASAIRVSRQWRRIGMLKSAWPALDLVALCASTAHCGITNASWSGPRVEFLPDPRLAPEAHVATANAFINNSLWTKHATHVRLHGTCFEKGGQRNPALPAFLGLPRFTRMQSLVLSDFIPAVEHVAEIFTALAPLLLALSLIPVSRTARESVQCARLLTNLRLLSISAFCTAGLLAPLVHLEALHVMQRFDLPDDENKELLVAIRRLSVEHQLRTIKIVDTHTERDVRGLVCSLRDGLAPATLM